MNRWTRKIYYHVLKHKCDIKYLRNQFELIGYDGGGNKHAEFVLNGDKTRVSEKHYFSNGQLLSTKTSNNGIIYGDYHAWHENGIKKFEIKFTNDGMEAGTSVWWFDTGQKEFEGYFDGDEYVFINWYANGRKLSEERCNNNGPNSFLVGPARAWYESGQQRYEENYVAGNLHGPLTEWDKNGQITRKVNYVNGVEEK